VVAAVGPVLQSPDGHSSSSSCSCSHEIDMVRNVPQQCHSLTAVFDALLGRYYYFGSNLPLRFVGVSAPKAPDISWNTWPEKAIHAAMSVVNYNLPLDIAPRVLTAVGLRPWPGCGRIVPAARLSRRAARVAVLFMVSPLWLQVPSIVRLGWQYVFGFLRFGATSTAELPRKSALLVCFAMLLYLASERPPRPHLLGRPQPGFANSERDVPFFVTGVVRVCFAISLRMPPGSAGLPTTSVPLSDGSRWIHTAPLLSSCHAFWLSCSPIRNRPVDCLSPYLEIAQEHRRYYKYHAALRTSPRSG